MCLFWTFPKNGMYVYGPWWLTSLLSLMFSVCIQLVARISTSFLFGAKWYPTIWINHILLSNSWWTLSCFHFLSTLNSAAIKHVFVYADKCFVSVDYMYLGTEFLGRNSNSCVWHLRSCPVFKWPHHFHSCQQCLRSPAVIYMFVYCFI